MSSLEIFIASISSILVLLNIYKIRIRIDNMVSLSYYILIIFLFAGSFVSLNGDWWLRKVSVENIHRAFILFHLTFIWFSLVVLFYTSVKDRIPVKEMDIKLHKGIEKLVFPLLIILILVLLLIFFLPDSALMAFLRRARNAEDLARLRGGQGYYFQGPKIVLYFKNLVMGPMLMYLVAFYGITHHLKNEYSKRFWFVLALTAFMLLIDLSKAPIVILILFVFLIRYRYAGSRIRLSKYLLIGGVVLLFVYSIAFNITIWESVPRILHRLTVSQYAGFPNALEVFPPHNDYLGINSISGSVSRLFGQEYISYSRILMEYANPSGVAQGTAGYMSTYYLAEAYAINGLWILVVAALITPLFLVLLDWVFRRANDVFFQAFYMVLLVRMPLILIDGFTRIYINQELIFLFVVVLTISYINHIALKYQNA
jgi:hypothetical protein